MRLRLAAAVAPVFVWGAAISALPHKEERFLYPVYPLVRASLPHLIRPLSHHDDNSLLLPALLPDLLHILVCVPTWGSTGSKVSRSM